MIFCYRLPGMLLEIDACVQERRAGVFELVDSVFEEVCLFEIGVVVPIVCRRFLSSCFLLFIF